MTATESRPILYKSGLHPYWCDLEDGMCDREGPAHIGRTSHMFVQSGEGRVSLQLSRYDDTLETDNQAGDIRVRVSMTDAGCVGRAAAVLDLDEIRTLALLCKKYVEMAESEGRSTIHVNAEAIREEGPM